MVLLAILDPISLGFEKPKSRNPRKQQNPVISSKQSALAALDVLRTWPKPRKTYGYARGSRRRNKEAKTPLTRPHASHQEVACDLTRSHFGQRVGVRGLPFGVVPPLVVDSVCSSSSYGGPVPNRNF